MPVRTLTAQHALLRQRIAELKNQLDPDVNCYASLPEYVEREYLADRHDRQGKAIVPNISHLQDGIRRLELVLATRPPVRFNVSKFKASGRQSGIADAPPTEAPSADAEPTQADAAPPAGPAPEPEPTKFDWRTSPRKVVDAYRFLLNRSKPGGLSVSHKTISARSFARLFGGDAPQIIDPTGQPADGRAMFIPIDNKLFDLVTADPGADPPGASPLNQHAAKVHEARRFAWAVRAAHSDDDITRNIASNQELLNSVLDDLQDEAWELDRQGEKGTAGVIDKHIAETRNGTSAHLMTLYCLSDAPVVTSPAEHFANAELRLSTAFTYMRGSGALFDSSAKTLCGMLRPLQPRTGPPDSCGVDAAIRAMAPSFARYAEMHPFRSKFPGLLTHAWMAARLQEPGMPPWDGRSPLVTTPARLGAMLLELGVGLEVYSVTGELLFKSVPKLYSTILSPNNLHLLYQDGHAVYVRNAPTPPKPKAHKPLLLEQLPPGMLEPHHALVNSPDELPAAVAAVLAAKPDLTHAHVTYNSGCMAGLLASLLAYGVTPTVYGSDFSTLVLGGLTTTQHGDAGGRKFKLSIHAPCKVNGELGLLFTGGEAEVQEYRTLVAELDAVLFHKDLMSSPTSECMALLCACPPRINVQSLPKDPSYRSSTRGKRPSAVAIDYSKFYPSAATRLEYVPIVTPFERWRRGAAPLGNTTLESAGGIRGESHLAPTYIYIVKVGTDSTDPFYPPGPHTLAFQHELADMPPHTIEAHLRILTAPINPVRAALTKLFASPVLGMAFKKAAANRAIGRCGTLVRQEHETLLCGNGPDAVALSMLRGGDVGMPGLWVLSRPDAPRAVDETLAPLRFMVLAEARRTLSTLHKQLLAAGACPVAVKTDCVYFLPGDSMFAARSEATARRKLDLEGWLGRHGYRIGPGLGEVKIADAKGMPLLPAKPPNPAIAAAALEAALAPPQLSAPSSLPIAAGACPAHLEFPTSTAVALPTPPHTCVFLARAGRGKTHSAVTQAAAHFGEGKVLGVAAWNGQARRLTKQYGVPGVTFCRLAGMNAYGELRRAPMDLSAHACVVLDEAPLLNHRQLVALRALIAKNPHVAFWATGDPWQLEAVNDLADAASKERWLKELLGTVVIIKKSARVSDPAEAARLERLEAELEGAIERGEALDLRAFMLRHFKTITLSQAKAAGYQHGLAYYHTTVERLNHALQTARQVPPGTPCVRLGPLRTPYHEGDALVCHTPPPGLPTSRGATFHIQHMGATHLTLQPLEAGDEEEDDDEKAPAAGGKGAADAPLDIPMDTVTAHFQLTHARTLHSAQGTTIAGPLLLADWDCKHVSARWLYTALTRAERLSDIRILVGARPPEDAPSEAQLKRRVAGYLAQDRKAGRDLTLGEPVDAAWWAAEVERTGLVCPGCQGPMTWGWGAPAPQTPLDGAADAAEGLDGCGEGSTVPRPNLVTLNRRNNALAHFKGNCELMCLGCNRGT